MPTGGDGTAYMGEKMDLKKADMGDVIKDFYKSDAPQFKGRSKEKRREMAIAAKLEADEVKEGVGSVVKGAVKFLAKKAKKYPAAGAVGLGAATGTNLMLMKKELQQNLPKKDKSKELFYKEALNDKDEPKLKKLHKMLLKSSDSHKKQAKLLAKSIKEQLGGTGPKVAPSPQEMKKKLTPQTLDARKQAQSNVVGKMNQLGGVTKTTSQNGKLSSMSIQSVGSGTNKAALASVLPKSGTGLKMDADGVVPDAGAAVQQKATQGIQMGQNMMNKSGAQFTSSQKQDFNTAKNYASSGQIKTDINRQIPGTQQFRYDIAADEINLASQKNKPKMNKGIKIGMQKEDISDEALNIQDWNSDDINFTEIETVDIIKPKPLIPSPSNWREELGEDWQKVNKKDKTDGMSQKAVNAYKRENPGSKLKTAVTTKPSKLKKGSKASKRRKSFCARSNGQKKMHNIDCSKTPDKAICKARRRWNC